MLRAAHKISRSFSGLAFGLTLVVVACCLARSSKSSILRGASASPDPSNLTRQVLEWLPADTETVIAANGPFRVSDLGTEQDFTKEPNREPDDELHDLPLGLFGFGKGLFVKHFEGEKIAFALEGSRNFRSPSGLGESPFNGCAIAIFKDDISSRAAEFVRTSSAAALRTEEVETFNVIVFQEKLEEDTWTTFVTFPRPNIAVAASNKDYLQEVLARINGKTGERAIPDSLPEWKHADTQAEVWAIRHYEKKEPILDPSSPFIKGVVWRTEDPRAIGLTFSFRKPNTATITYLSGDSNILAHIQATLSMPYEPGARTWHTRYRQLGAGAVEASFDLQRGESAWLFALLLEGLLGHSVFV